MSLSRIIAGITCPECRHFAWHDRQRPIGCVLRRGGAIVYHHPSCSVVRPQTVPPRVVFAKKTPAQERFSRAHDIEARRAPPKTVTYAQIMAEYTERARRHG